MNYSVLMSVYSKEKPAHLLKSIQSVLNQTVLTDDFVIICDGPLTDDLYEVLHSFEILHPRMFNIQKREKNEGLGSALSYGIKIVKNDIVMRMDSDDICVRDRAEKQLKLMETYDLVGSWISEFERDEDNIIGYRRVPQNYLEIRKYAKKRCPFNHPTVMFKKEIILNAGNYQTMLFVEDYYLWIRILLNSEKVYNSQEVLVNMRSGRDMRARRSGKVYR